MSEAFENAKKSLAVKCVTLRESYVTLNDDININEFDEINAEAQAFRGVQKVRESSVRTEDETFWEYHFYYSCGIRLVEENDNSEVDEDSEPLVEIKATFNATYRSVEKVAKEQVEAFSEENVGYHVWPYWREFVQSSCSRLDIAPIETPFYFCTSK